MAEYPMVVINVELAEGQADYVKMVTDVTHALAITYALVLSRPDLLLGLWSRIIKTSVEMFAEEIKAKEFGE